MILKLFVTGMWWFDWQHWSKGKTCLRAGYIHSIIVSSLQETGLLSTKKSLNAFIKGLTQLLQNKLNQTLPNLPLSKVQRLHHSSDRSINESTIGHLDIQFPSLKNILNFRLKINTCKHKKGGVEILPQWSIQILVCSLHLSDDKSAFCDPPC